MPFIGHFVASLITFIDISLLIQPRKILPIQDQPISELCHIVLTIIESCYFCHFNTRYCFITLFVGSIVGNLPSFLLEKLLFFYYIIRVFGSVCNIECNLFTIIRSFLLLFFYVILKSFLKNIKLFGDSMLVTVNRSFSIHSIFIQAISVEVFPVHFVGDFEVV